MCTNRTAVLVLSFVISCINIGQGQKLKVMSIEENRTIGGSWDYCKIEVMPIGDEIRSFTYYKISELKRAVDNKNINILTDQMEESKYLPITENTTIQLLKASRAASTINIDGTMSLYKPTEENGGLVKISGFKNKPEVNLAPKNAAYTVHFYDKATLQKMGNSDMNQQFEDIEKLPEKDRNFASEVNALVNGLPYYTEDQLENILFFAIGGDNTQIMGLDFEDEKGIKITPVSTATTNVSYTFYFEFKPDPKMKLILNVESPKAIKKIPFSLLGVDLP